MYIASSHRNTIVNKYSVTAYCMICVKTLKYKSDKRVNQKNYIRLTCITANCIISITKIVLKEIILKI